MDEDRPHHHHHPTDEATHHHQMTADASHEIKPKDEATHDHNKGDGHHHNENDGHTKGDGSLQKEEHQGEGLMKEFNGNVSDECTMHAEEVRRSFSILVHFLEIFQRIPVAEIQLLQTGTLVAVPH